MTHWLNFKSIHAENLKLCKIGVLFWCPHICRNLHENYFNFSCLTRLLTWTIYACFTTLPFYQSTQFHWKQKYVVAGLKTIPGFSCMQCIISHTPLYECARSKLLFDRAKSSHPEPSTPIFAYFSNCCSSKTKIKSSKQNQAHGEIGELYLDSKSKT